MASRRQKTEHGTVTAELALLFPVLLATIVAGVWATGLVVANIRCIDAARDVARAVARGESPETATTIGHRAAPENATIDITTTEHGEVQVVVTAERHLDWPLFAALPPISVHAQAILQAEPGEQPPP
ncbi:TadE family protein [Kribbella flavida DSM 17836]|uniref:TadE family protein n=1 Tax=Kribbella flavida (strain DSM 17836 / JCM 10339 / NBRC 14399) TaxID=479435 RepID=D2PW23_KRIFD|nr:TadE family type IV pilus minor pilin [Kribbella flavida]ADB29680.1 TadE family protein [Kribbella flavida DSM 17836]